MPKPRSIILFLLLALWPALTPAAAPAAPYFVAPMSGEGVEAGLTKTVERLIVVAVNEAGQTVVAEESKAGWTLKSELLKLGYSYIVTITKLKSGSTEVAYADKKKAASAEELDEVVSRLTADVVHGKPAGADVLPRVTTPITPIPNRRSKVFGLGPMRVNGLGTPEGDTYAYYLHGGLQIDVNPRASITLLGETSFKIRQLNAGSFVAAVQLGANYCLSDADNAPYVGLDLGYGAAGSEAVRAIFGVAAGARLGMLFFRSSATRLSLEARHMSILENNGTGMPGHTGLVLSILF